MKVKTIQFGIIKEILGKASADFELKEGSAVEDFKHLLEKEYPDLQNLHYLKFAVNDEYVDDHFILKENDEVALIPPVAGG